jgi:hypothetical protein
MLLSFLLFNQEINNKTCFVQWAYDDVTAMYEILKRKSAKGETFKYAHALIGRFRRGLIESVVCSLFAI